MGNIWGFRDNGELIFDANLINSKISQNSYLAISGLFSGERSIEVILTANYVPYKRKEEEFYFLSTSNLFDFE